MATTTTKKKKTKAKPPSGLAKKYQPKQASATEELRRERDEALEQLAAASEILRMLARAPTDLQPVLDAIAESAAKLCDAADAVLWRVDGDVFHLASHFGSIPTRVGRGQGHAITRGMPASRAIVDRETIHIHDLAAAETEFPEAKTAGIAMGVRTTLVAPLLCGGKTIGSLHIRRREVRPFSDRQIKLLETFADQAVIAIENARLFQGLTESLEQQSATSEILRVIAGSPTDIQPVLDVVAENAARLCDAKDAQILRVEGDLLRVVASFGQLKAFAEDEVRPITRGYVTGRAVTDRQTIHLYDLLAEVETEFPEAKVLQQRGGHRTTLATPLLREGIAIGAILILRGEVRPFTDKQIALLKTFADQAVIAIENVRLFKELQERNRDLTEALEQQTATSEILRVIASSPTDLQPVLNAIAENATRLCDAKDVSIGLVEGAVLKVVASYGMMARWWPDEGVPINRGSVTGRTIVDRQPIHVHDLSSESDEEFPLGKIYQKRGGHRTNLGIPLLREGVPIGVIAIRRMEVWPFSDKQIKLLETFADQAVIAIENVRLFKELEERNAELREALEHQTATAEVLGIISRSPTDVQPVLDAIVESAARVCGVDDVLLRLHEGNSFVSRAHFGSIPIARVEISIDEPQFRWMREHGTLHIPDARAQNDFPMVGSAGGWRTLLVVPLRQHGEIIGNLNARRTQVRPFTPAQIKLLETFADQAVIAIENVRLFNELDARNRDLTEALEQQTATSEILRVIASSPTDIQPVLNAIAESAARLCSAKDAVIRLVEGSVLRLGAHQGPIPFSFAPSELPINRGSVTGRAVVEGQPVHIEDFLSVAATEFPEIQAGFEREGDRTQLAVPLMREGVAIGAILIRRTTVDPFTDKQILLLKTFADQAVIAIENVRLFQELTEALEQQTATSQILGVIASSPTDIQPVLDVIAENATLVCGADDAAIRLVEKDGLRLVAHHGSIRIEVPLRPIDRNSAVGRAVFDRAVIHHEDLLAIVAKEYPIRAADIGQLGIRTMLAAPLMRESQPIGVIIVRRTVVQPFTEKQITLLKTFADQAVIAIENVRLFKELGERNAELREALEHQTATSNILQVIASSPTNIQPVLDAVAENAGRLCDANDTRIMRVEGDVLRPVAHYGPLPDAPRGEGTPISRGWPSGRAVVDGRMIHVHDLASEMETEFPESKIRQAFAGTRTMLVTPLLREGVPIGVIVIRRTEVRPFTEKQIALLQTFADQAVIAIENVRLFKELTEALEQQTATSEILGVIASSPTDIQPVLDAVAATAARLCDARDVLIDRVNGDFLEHVAAYGPMPMAESRRPLSRGTPAGKAIIERQTIHIHDVVPLLDTEYPEAKARQQVTGTRTALVVPLLREGVAIGTIQIRRPEVRPFSEKQIALLKTFADQAVIAIENVRLFKEIQERNAELREALEHQTATAEVLGIISRSPTDVQPVLDAIVESAARVCGVDDVVLQLREGNVMVARSHFGPVAIRLVEISIDAPEFRWMREHGTLHIPDVRAQNDFPLLGSAGHLRTFLAAPLRQQGELVGLLNARRTEVRPFTAAQIKLLETFADQAVIAIENVRLFKELQERTRELVESVEEMKALGEVGQAVSSSLDLETVLETIVSRAVDLSGTDCGVIYEFDEATQEFNLRASHRMEPEAVEGLRAARIKLGEGATGQAAMTRAPVQIPDTFELREKAVSRVRSLLNRLGYRSLLTVPILREQQIMGGLTVWRRQVGEFEPEVVNLLQTFATQSALAIQNARLFREIEDKSRQIEAANRHKSEFLANMSHELRTPLNAIIGFSEVLGEKLFGELNDKQAEYTDDILTSGRHLLSLINEILDLSKVEAGRMELELATFDLPTALENARTFVRERAVRHAITLDVSVDERLGDFVGDERKIKQILLNLLSNAVKFTPEGGRIGINARQTDGSVEISVTDTGIGIAQEDQARIFEEFRQVGSDYAHKGEGTGLGLTLAKKFVELHGGKIWVESEVGEGQPVYLHAADELSKSILAQRRKVRQGKNRVFARSDLSF